MYNFCILRYCYRIWLGNIAEALSVELLYCLFPELNKLVDIFIQQIYDAKPTWLHGNRKKKTSVKDPSQRFAAYSTTINIQHKYVQNRSVSKTDKQA